MSQNKNKIQSVKDRLKNIAKEKNLSLDYPLETVIAEKFESIITLDRTNSRMKDFFDLYAIFKNCELDYGILIQAIRNTFDKRKTTLPDKPAAFTAQFYNEPNRVRMWNIFIRKIRFMKKVALQDILVTVKEQLKPIYIKIKTEKTE